MNIKHEDNRDSASTVQINFNIKNYRFFIYQINYGGVYGNSICVPIFPSSSRLTGSVASSYQSVVTASFTLDINNNGGTLTVASPYFGNGAGVRWGFI